MGNGYGTWYTRTFGSGTCTHSRCSACHSGDPFEDDFVGKVKEVTNGGVNVAIEVTGQGAGLNEALDCVAKFGRVALLGCTRESDFTVDYYRKVHGPGITLIGAHTLARPENDSYPGFFTTADDIKSVLKLCAGERLDFKSIKDGIKIELLKIEGEKNESNTCK